MTGTWGNHVEATANEGRSVPPQLAVLIGLPSLALGLMIAVPAPRVAIAAGSANRYSGI